MALRMIATAPTSPERRVAPRFDGSSTAGVARAAAFVREHGYAVVSGCATAADCATIMEETWDWIEGLGTGVDRRDPTTWGDDRWPMAAGASGILPSAHPRGDHFLDARRERTARLDARRARHALKDEVPPCSAREAEGKRRAPRRRATARRGASHTGRPWPRHICQFPL